MHSPVLTNHPCYLQSYSDNFDHDSFCRALLLQSVLRPVYIMSIYTFYVLLV